MGILEIQTFLPSVLLDLVDFEQLDMERFIELYAKTKVIEDFHVSILNKAIALTFSEE